VAVSIDFTGRSAVVFGVANHRSIAWAIAQRFHDAGAALTVTYQNVMSLMKFPSRGLSPPPLRKPRY
jgi:enoyl-[acyl-carrier protein] reductase I